MPALVRMQGIVKRFGDVVANDGVAFELRSGEVHALLGENGAGKTTLMNALYGLSLPDAGTIEVAGRPIRPRHPADAIVAGIGMVHQHPLLIDPLTVAENMRLGGVGDGTAVGLRAAVAALAEELPLEVDPGARVADLPMSKRQRLEILRCLARGVRVLILDEPTAVLTPVEAAALFVHIRRLAARGHGVVFISHRLAEVCALADRVTVLRNGRNAGTFPAQRISPAELAERMVGRALSDDPPTAATAGPVRLSLDACSVHDRFGRTELDAVSLEVRAGEIVSIAGVEGNGQRPLGELLFGLRQPSAGRVAVEGHTLPGIERWAAADIKVGRIPGDRRGSGLLMDAPLWRNLLLGPMARHPPGRLLATRGILSWARALLEAYRVAPADPLLPAAKLSGGNQQKVVLARELSGDPRLVVAVNPTQGLDVGAQQEVQRRLTELRDRGTAVVVISTDLDEVLRLGDRVGVLYGGRLRGPVSRAQAPRERIGRLMAGLPDSPAASWATGVVA